MRRCPNCGEENPDKAKFCIECGTDLTTAGPAPTEVRKTVTILFSDITGSTALGEATDPETVRRHLSRYFKEVRRVVEAHGGTVEKFIGDAVMAVFGVPQLHEDDALRAVRAAVEAGQALEALNESLEKESGVRLNVRTGINTGEVVVGDPEAGETLVTGDAVNVAARLEQSASSGEILIGENTFRVVKSAVEADRVEPLHVKGKSDPLIAYRLIRVTGDQVTVRRLDSRLVGREAELRLLEEAYERTLQGRVCHLFTILGSAGVGKSRLIAEFVGRRTDAHVLQGRCLPYGDGITFWPIVQTINTAIGLRDDDSIDDAIAKLKLSLEGRREGNLIEQRLASMLGLSDSEIATEEMFWALRKFYESLAREKPLVIIIDDVHWGEATLLDLIEHFAEWTRDAPILLLAMARPELIDERPGWGGGHTNATTIQLEPLSAEESSELIDNLLGQAGLAEEARHRIAEAAEGTPLFLEEMLAMLIDDGLLQRTNGHWKPTRDLSDVVVPPTIQALLSTRLDRLNDGEKRVVGRASVVGQEFWTGAVAFLDETDRAQLGQRLMSLVRKELVRPEESTVEGEDAFRFRHLLIRDAAYDSLPKETRATLHQRFAQWMENVSATRVRELEEIIGYHLETAFTYRQELGLVDDQTRDVARKAAGLLGSAGRRALGRNDLPAAENLLARALGLTAEDSLDRVDLLLESVEVQLELGNFATAGELLKEARNQTAQHPSKATLVAVYELNLEFAADIGLDALDIRSKTEDLVGELERSQDIRGLAKAWGLVGLCNNALGHMVEMEQAFLKSEAYAKRAGDRRQEWVAKWWFLAAAALGPHPVDEMLARSDDVKRVTATESKVFEAMVAGMEALGEAMRGNFGGGLEIHEAARAAMLEMGMKVMYGGTAMVRAWIEGWAGRFDEAARVLKEGDAVLEELGESGYRSTTLAELARALFEIGDLKGSDEAARLSQELTMANDIASVAGWKIARARLLAVEGKADEAVALGREAVAAMDGSDMLNLIAEVIADLADTYRIVGRIDEARIELERALSLYEQKGNLAAAAQIRRKLQMLTS
jgi:class 3 adenylate cyclase/tetratricopeptide (TPR) repeat protein